MEEKDYEYTGYNKNLMPNARSLRKNMTPQERRLWHDFLKTYPIRFYRQRSIDFYIADFYCSKAKLVVELDGAQHYTPNGKEYDKLRTEIIELHGIEVVRFSNTDINNNFYNVCSVIDNKVKERIDL
ncbi:MAG: endonuclease domain-containing protein [Faecalibacterium sp.]|nr:endonuclease domain-containing protein [Ruminococcus sp.]MCM1393018.1 endonuclease domain-containing protein [Ruminococcus sp.]MCM1486088.1 endonuclease domain-containing protein [Faecalibacterium sp.]